MSANCRVRCASTISWASWRSSTEAQPGVSELVLREREGSLSVSAPCAWSRAGRFNDNMEAEDNEMPGPSQCRRAAVCPSESEARADEQERCPGPGPDATEFSVRGMFCTAE